MDVASSPPLSRGPIPHDELDKCLIIFTDIGVEQYLCLIENEASEMRSPPKLSSLRNNRIFLLFLALVLFVSSDCAAAEDAKPERSYRLFAENAVARQAVLQLARDNLVDIYQVRKGHYIDFKTSHSIVEGLKKRFVVEETTLQVLTCFWHLKTSNSVSFNDLSDFYVPHLAHRDVRLTIDIRTGRRTQFV